MSQPNQTKNPGGRSYMDYERCNAAFEAWFKAEFVSDEHRTFMWYAWRAGWTRGQDTPRDSSEV